MMAPPSRPQHGPFNDGPTRRPTSRAAAAAHLQDAYTASSGHALRSAATSSRDPFATTLSRRPTAATSSAHVNQVLEDEDKGEDRATRRGLPVVRTKTRRNRAATETTVEPNEDEPAIGDLVIRDKSGNYLHQIPMVDEPEAGLEEEQLAEDARLTAITRDFWLSGGGVGGRGSRRMVDEDLKSKADTMVRMREAVDKKLAEERWKYEPTDYLEELRIRNHGI